MVELDDGTITPVNKSLIEKVKDKKNVFGQFDRFKRIYQVTCNAVKSMYVPALSR